MFGGLGVSRLWPNQDRALNDARLALPEIQRKLDEKPQETTGLGPRLRAIAYRFPAYEADHPLPKVPHSFSWILMPS